MSDKPVVNRPAPPPISPIEMQQQAYHIQSVLKDIMKPGVHYGIIPGTKKNTLLKPGAEKLLSTFRIAVQPKVEDLSTDDCIRYRVTVVGVNMATGVAIGTGLGECSSNEDKYKWRKAVCQAESDQTHPKRKKTTWKNSQNGPYCINQVRTNPYDCANTVLKMAKKRAQIDLCLTALAASDVFEAEGDANQQQNSNQPPPRQGGYNDYPESGQQQPKKKEVPVNLDAKQVAFLTETLSRCNISLDDFLAHFKISSIDQLGFRFVNDAVAWITEQ